ncbi:MAG: imidazole glycerol phosphate synthase subunit HisH [Ignavibacteriae bacterium]|nr:MAG: imidazole glycerol phosphate synthase subunit HisH [Ignavibacteriota bacterium]
MIGIINYGAGNIRSVSNALNRLSVPHFISSDYTKLNQADKLIFPGVGEARSAMDALNRAGLTEWLKEVSVPFLGICLGMQLLFDHTTERATGCLGVVSGTNERFNNNNTQLKVPHMGWNQVRLNGDNPLFSGMRTGEYFYFVHSYYAPIVQATIGTTEYDVQFTSAIQQKNYYGVQFHPEKSSTAGLKLLKNFIDVC